jgi:hypothetical protein
MRFVVFLAEWSGDHRPTVDEVKQLTFGVRKGLLVRKKLLGLSTIQYGDKVMMCMHIHPVVLLVCLHPEVRTDGRRVPGELVYLVCEVNVKCSCPGAYRGRGLKCVSRPGALGMNPRSYMRS